MKIRGLILGSISAFLSLPMNVLAQDDFTSRRLEFASKAPEVTLEAIIVDHPQPLGTIVGSFHPQVNLANGDIIYLQLANSSVSPGDRFTIYEDLGSVSHPYKVFSKIGHHLLVKGMAQVIRITANGVIARIFDSTINIHQGDKLAAPIPISFNIHPNEPSTMVKGVVLDSARNVSNIGSFDFAFIDKGAADGLKVNDLLYIYRSADGDIEINPKLPTVNIAEVIVMETEEHVATVYCLDGTEAFFRGSAFKSAQSDLKYLSPEPTIIPQPAPTVH